MSKTGQFVLQIVGITDGLVLSRPSKKHRTIGGLVDVHLQKKNIDVLAYSPSNSCDGLINEGTMVLLAPCPPDEEDINILVSMGSNVEPFTHYIFLSVFKEVNEIPKKPLKPTLFNKIAPIPIIDEPDPAPEPEPQPVIAVKAKRGRKKKEVVENIVIVPIENDDDDEDETENEQFIATNPKIAIELMESIIEKNLLTKLPPVRIFKRNIHIYLEDKVNSTFSFVGFCDDGIPFNMEVNNVPYAEYDHGTRIDEMGSGVPCKTMKHKFNKKTAYFPEKKCKNTEQMIQRIKDLTTIKRESVTRCYLSYIVQRTDIDQFQFSLYNDEYRAAVIEAVESGVIISPVVISWTREGIALFVTDEIPVLYPTLTENGI
jgi:hypothetical protein